MEIELIQELISMSTNNLDPIDSEDRNVFLGPHTLRTQEIGHKLYEIGGIVTMIHAFNQVPTHDQLELRHAWDGVGMWQS